MRKQSTLLPVIVIVAALVGAACLMTSGCDRKEYRKVDVASGQYYAEDEILALPVGAQGSYCRDLETVRSETQQVFETRLKESKETSDLIASTRAEKDRLEREIVTLAAEIRTLGDQIEEAKRLPTSWRIRAGETLASISVLPAIYNDYDKWWKLFEANKDLVFDPWYSALDTVIVVPRDWPTQ
jgi:nucleoid-associated protein YgaU